MARDKKEKKAALHLLNEMKVNTRVTKEEEIFLCIIQWIFTCFSVFAVIFTLKSCFGFDYVGTNVIITTIILQSIIYPIIYMYGKKNFKIPFVIMFGVMVVVGFIFRKLIFEGFIYMTEEFLDAFNIYYDQELYISYECMKDVDEAVGMTISIFIAFMLIWINLVTVVINSKTLYGLITLPWFGLCLMVGIAPKGFPFMLYCILYMGMCATTTIKSIASNGKKICRQNYYRSMVVKMILSMCTVFVVLAVIVSLIIPRKYYDKEELKIIRSDFEDNLTYKIDMLEEKYTWNLDIIDYIFGIEDPTKNEEEEEEKEEKKPFDFEWDYTAEKEYLENLLGKTSLSFYDGFDHGSLQKYKGKANISEDKYYVIETEKRDEIFTDLYLKTYQSSTYDNGKWSSYKNDVIEEHLAIADEKFNSQINNFYLLNEYMDYTYRPTDVKIIPQKKSSEKFYIPYGTSSIREKDGNYLYSLWQQYPVNIIYNPYSLSSIPKEEYLFEENYIRKGLMEDYTGEIDIMTVPFKDSNLEYENLYDIYTEVPSECKEIEDEMKKVANDLGIDVKNHMFDNFEESYYYYYCDVEKAVEYVINRYFSGFVYTLEPDINPNEDPVVWFLNNSQEGYCMHYASAAVIMLRSMGIPARYVEGFMVPAENMYGSKKVNVYGTNAHAWIEIYVKGLGWMPKEVTVAPSIDGLSFYEVAEEERVEREKTPTKAPTKTPTKSPTKKPTKTPTKAPTKVPTKSPATNAPIVQDKRDLHDNNIELIISILVCVTLCGVGVAGIVYSRKRLRKSLNSPRKVYEFVNKTLDNVASKKHVIRTNDMSNEEYAKLFTDKIPQMSYENMCKVMEIKTRIKFSKDKFKKEDAMILKDVYNEYMDNVFKDYSKVKVFYNIKIKGVIRKI